MNKYRDAAGPRLTRRAALLMTGAASLLGGCSLLDDIFYTTKAPLPGRRESVSVARGGLTVSQTPPRVVLPPAVMNAEWPQAGGNPAHLMGHLAAGERLAQIWTANIGEGGGYRRKILAEPVIAAGRVFTMDSDGVIDAFDAGTGRRLWSFETQPAKNRSTNVGGGLGEDGGVIYASTGRAEVLAVDAGSGKLIWRQPIGAPARSAPTIADGRVFVTTMRSQLVALASKDGQRLWSFQAPTSDTTVLGTPAPAYGGGLVVAGFGSGDLAALRAETGTVAWTDSIAAASGRTSLADLAAITASPVIDGQTVYVLGLGGLLVAIDLRAGRRLWERDVAGAQTPWVAGDWMFCLTTDQQLAAISTRDGVVSWLIELPRYRNPERQRNPIQWKGPVLVGDRLVLAGTNERAVAISPYTGDTLGEQKLTDAASLAPVVAGGTLFFVTDDGALTALR